MALEEEGDATVRHGARGRDVELLELRAVMADSGDDVVGAVEAQRERGEILHATDGGDDDLLDVGGLPAGGARAQVEHLQARHLYQRVVERVAHYLGPGAELDALEARMGDDPGEIDGYVDLGHEGRRPLGVGVLYLVYEIAHGAQRLHGHSVVEMPWHIGAEQMSHGQEERLQVGLALLQIDGGQYGYGPDYILTEGSDEFAHGPEGQVAQRRHLMLLRHFSLSLSLYLYLFLIFRLYI